MSKTCNQNQKVSLKYLKRSNKKEKNKIHTITAQKGSATIVISVLSDGKIMMQDYSRQDDRYKLIRLLNEMGVNTETIFDSPCG